MERSLKFMEIMETSLNCIEILWTHHGHLWKFMEKINFVRQNTEYS